MSQLQLSGLDRTVVGYTGVDAAAVADAERVTVTAVREARTRLGRRPSDGKPVDPDLVHADYHARRARDLQRAGKTSDALLAWSEANYQANAAIAAMMRANRAAGL